MKFKMAENSLFAILLRSPWWASLLVAGGIALVSRALLPQEYVVFGVIGALPFFVIACMSGWRQFKAPSPARLAQTLDAAAALPWNAFAEALAEGFRREGYAVSPAPGKQSDLRLEKNGSIVLVSARRWKAARHGVEPIRELLAAIKAADADKGIYVAIGELSDNARTEAAAAGMGMVDGTGLARMLAGLVPAPASKA